MDKPLVVSAVRNWAMHEHCIADNLYWAECDVRVLDNRIGNERIPVLYNRVLDGLDCNSSRWLVFCHEDFKPFEAVDPCLVQADERMIYGVIGGILAPRRSWLLGGVWGGAIRGQIVESEKDGACARVHGVKVPLGTIVETVDCQCLIVHSSLVQKYGLRFDENLSFDLYTEDFCLGAYLKHGIL